MPRKHTSQFRYPSRRPQEVRQHPRCLGRVALGRCAGVWPLVPALAITLGACSGLRSAEVGTQVSSRSSNTPPVDSHLSTPSVIERQLGERKGEVSQEQRVSHPSNSHELGRENISSRAASLVNERAIVEDAVPDRDNAAKSPSYVEVVRASLEGVKSYLRLILRLKDAPPRRLRPDLTLMAGFNLESTEKQEFAIFGSLSQHGWTSHFQSGVAKELRGRFSATGKELRFEIDWRELGEARVFRWVTGAALKTAGSESSPPLLIGWDKAPNEGWASFPDSRRPPMHPGKSQR